MLSDNNNASLLTPSHHLGCCWVPYCLRCSASHDHVVLPGVIAASGFFYGLLNGESPEQCLRLGWAHGALLTTYEGDTTMASINEVEAFAKGGSARIQR